ncbi:hypothetical protein FZC79_21405 [Rossellomorea vietnamensis]|uniref:Uncharacterized protein n=1 Tax=Rossellomorea vietnamensis TaxID=218284 RepID=A0A5D4K7W9_9BACI|nr:hypothetical protein [Rossellomorea vietnamensis]TYR72790.1 hypothetical protein FZC79_21405 [Rossellomorea vietnamensis]
MEFSLSFIINIIIAVYLFVDARKRGKNPWLWGILGLIFGAIVLGIYFIQTGRKGLGWVIVILAILWFILALILGIVGALFGLLV